MVKKTVVRCSFGEEDGGGSSCVADVSEKQNENNFQY